LCGFISLGLVCRSFYDPIGAQIKAKVLLKNTGFVKTYIEHLKNVKGTASRVARYGPSEVQRDCGKSSLDFAENSAHAPPCLIRSGGGPRTHGNQTRGRVVAEFDDLAKALFEGKVAAGDFKTMPGTSPDMSRDEAARHLLESMKRMGLIVDGQLVNKIEQKS
jgi:hypothetical protein